MSRLYLLSIFLVIFTCPSVRAEMLYDVNLGDEPGGFAFTGQEAARETQLDHIPIKVLL